MNGHATILPIMPVARANAGHGQDCIHVHATVLVLFDNTARSQLPPAQLLLAYEGTTQRTRRMIYGLRVIVATPDLGDNPVVQPGVVMVTG